MSSLQELREKLHSDATQVAFNDVIQIINEHYDYTPAAFSNGIDDDCVMNKAGENEGSCKVFAFASINQLTIEQTLNCFGDYYRVDVLQHPEHDDHANIRTFMRHGWEGIEFDQSALKLTD